MGNRGGDRLASAELRVRAEPAGPVDRRAGLELLFIAEYGRLVGYCRRVVGDEQEAQDVAQESFVRLIGRWSSLREPRAYLYVVATNLLRRSLQQRQGLLPGQAGGGELGSELAIRDLVLRLPKRLRSAVVLHYYADLPVSEVAAALHAPVGSVKRWLHEARTLLAVAWENADE